MHKLHQCRLDSFRNIVRQRHIILYLFAVNLKLHILNTQIGRFCIVGNRLQHILVFAILYQLTRNIRVIAGEEDFVSEPAHRGNAGHIIHGAGHREKQLILGNCFANQRSFYFFLRKGKLLLRAPKDQCFLPLRSMIEIFRINLLACSSKAVPIFDTAGSVFKRKL